MASSKKLQHKYNEGHLRAMLARHLPYPAWRRVVAGAFSESINAVRHDSIRCVMKLDLTYAATEAKPSVKTVRVMLESSRHFASMTNH